MEKIIRIEETTFKVNEDSYGAMDGYQIITDEQTIKLGIDNGQSCCENWGYFMSEDNLEEFEGAGLIDIQLTDTQLETKEINIDEMYEGDGMFVNIITSKGLLQFVAYNQHNGYYGHSSCVISSQLNHTTTL